ncbi:hypothetical protein EG850_04455 [Gulosibacter macacae]|uniref:DUF3322 and DUF2220 domain-containing protein n=2 Tax=Gulosibacter macacae TaxID=2488791 RepID=A0A3P3VZP9_9MICO|nr:hypothetical protein EG850_04455 [Gulosibacter macacae]
MMSVNDARATASARLERNLGSWAVDPTNASLPAFAAALHPPTQSQALADVRATEAWVREWAAFSLDGAVLEWQPRKWSALGSQQVPVRITITEVATVAKFVGGSLQRRWSELRDRAQLIRDELGDSAALTPVLRRNARTFEGYSPERFTQFLAAVQWLVEHPVDGLRPRQIPVRGVDSKWFRDHRSVASELCLAVTGRAGLGIIDSDPLIRVRVLDSALAPGGVAEFAAPVEQLAALPLTPAAVFVFENLESVLAMPQWPGAVAVHGSGYAVDVLTQIPWVLERPVIYWGDLDANGFAILHRLRKSHAAVTSALMDASTLLMHRDLWVVETKPPRGRLDTLTPVEAEALAVLRDEGDARLEQERIPWAYSLAALQRVWAEVTGN